MTYLFNSLIFHNVIYAFLNVVNSEKGVLVSLQGTVSNTRALYSYSSNLDRYIVMFISCRRNYVCNNNDMSSNNYVIDVR